MQKLQVSYYISPLWKVAPGDILPLQIRHPVDFYRQNVAGGDILHELIICPRHEKSAYPIKNPLPIKMSPLSKALFVT